MLKEYIYFLTFLTPYCFFLMLRKQFHYLTLQINIVYLKCHICKNLVHFYYLLTIITPRIGHTNQPYSPEVSNYFSNPV